MRLYKIKKCECGSNLAFCKQTGPHYGLYCKECFRWIRWLSKKEKEIRDGFWDQAEEDYKRGKQI